MRMIGMRSCIVIGQGLLLAGLWACTHTCGPDSPCRSRGDAPKAQAPAEKAATDATIGSAAKAPEAPRKAAELPKPPRGDPVDNSRCQVCHINFADEELAVNHANAGVGCEKCHGKSDAHCGDEANVTAPEIMYAKEDINAACMHCHKALPDDHKAVVEGTATKEKYCTDCHGAHKIPLRSRAWDKRTGKLIVK